MPRKKKKKEPKQRNWTVQHVMRKGVQKHRNRKKEAKDRGYDERSESE